MLKDTSSEHCIDIVPLYLFSMFSVVNLENILTVMLSYNQTNVGILDLWSMVVHW